MEPVLGTMNIAYPYSSSSSSSSSLYASILDLYVASVKKPILDTAYYYGNTTTEAWLGSYLEDKREDTITEVATKANPWFDNDFTSGRFGQLSSFHLTRQLLSSLQSLRREKIETFFLHCPDPETPVSETLRTCDDLWRHERFDTLGLSNFSLAQTEEILDLCDKEGFVSPRIYQGMYNLLARRVEELFPLLEREKIQFWSYNPLAGGLLTGKYKTPAIPTTPSRFTNNGIYQSIFWKPALWETWGTFFQEGDPLTTSLSWLQHHSCMRAEDRIVVGVSTPEQWKTNWKALQTPPFLSETIVQDLNRRYQEEWAPAYFY
jgi:aflatoxin B1 aldehyde reductase